MNKKFFAVILIIFFVFGKISAQTNAGYELALTAFSASATVMYSITNHLQLR